jgi:ADP-ribose pyrophosphatase
MSDQAQVVSKQRVYEGKLLKIDLEQVQLPQGKTATLETIRHPGAAAALPFLDAQRVALIRQYRHAAGGYLIEVPAGKLDAGEHPDLCAKREVEEETGYRVGALVPLGAVLTTPGFTDEVIWLYEAHQLESVPMRHESDEVIERIELSFEQAVAWVRSGQIRDAKSVAAISLATLRRV